MTARSLTRRDCLQAGLGLLGLPFAGRAKEHSSLPPIRTITRGPRFHWFGYYDKLQFDPTGRYVLAMEVDFEHRSPKADDLIHVGMVDLHDGDHWIELGRTTAWCWQQGCMLQWLPGSKTTILWNDREGQQYVCRLLDVRTRQMRTIPHAIYNVSPNGRTALAADFRRLAETRPGYGYVGVPDPHAADPAPKDSGIFRVDLVTGKQDLTLSLADIARFGRPLESMAGAKHKVNHLLFNPDGSRFVFLHRWRGPGGRETRMLTANPDGSDLRVLDDNGLTSHFIWRDSKNILAFSRQRTHGQRFYVFQDGSTLKIEVVGQRMLTQDGHCSYLPGGEWIVCDTYPDHFRCQHVYLYHVPTGRQIALGHFHLPSQYDGEWRCDTHPRVSPDGRFIVIDSPHTGAGRQMHLIDIREVIA